MGKIETDPRSRAAAFPWQESRGRRVEADGLGDRLSSSGQAHLPREHFTI